MLLKFAIMEFIEERQFREVSPKTIENYNTLFNDFYLYCLSQEIIDTDDITPQIIKSYLIYCKTEKNNTPTSMNTKLTAIKTLFNYLIEIDVIDPRENPAKKVGYVHADVKITTFNDDQIKQILTYYRRIKNKDKTYFAYRDYMIITFLVSTGVRLGEMCNLKWDDVDLINKHIVVYGKLRVQQGIPMAESLRIALQGYHIFCEKEFGTLPEYVFVNRKCERLTENAVQNIFKRLKDAMKFSNVRCCAHDFRRYYAKTLILQGADAFTVQKLLRHSKMDMTQKYVGLYGQDLDQRNEKWNPLNKFDV